MSLDIQVSNQPKINIPVRQHTSYTSTPNFVLVSDSPKPEVIFGDLIPFYKSYQQLSEIVVTSWENLASFVLQSHIFAVCVLSFLGQLINSAVYQSYITLLNNYQSVVTLPETFADIKNSFTQLLEILSTERTRSLWLLDMRLSLANQVDAFIHRLSTTFQIVRKFYLVAIIVTFLGSLTLSTGQTFAQRDSSFARYVDTTSYVSATPVVAGVQTEAVTLTDSTTLNTNKIFEYIVEEGDTIESIADKFSLQSVSVQFNNGLGDTVEAGKVIYLPWKDMYIYRVEADISAGELERIYSIAKDDIITANVEIIDGELFARDSLILIPSRDFTAIADANKAEEVRKVNIAATTNTRVSGTPNLSQGADIGLIFPTVQAGTRVSRCLQPGHVACDFANRSAPPIFAAKTGRVTVARYGYNAGYGNYVKIDHGGGVVTSYMHLTDIYVQEGQSVIQGETIGQMGTTGFSTGIHLHFEVIINGALQSPGRYLPWMPPCETSCRW